MSVTHQDRVEAATTAIATLIALGHEDLVDELVIQWKEAFTARLGDALYRPNGSTARVSGYSGSGRPETGTRVVRVRFSAPLWPRASKQDRYETVVHEICHIVCSHEAALAGRPRPQAHGSAWKSLMWKAGVEPKRCHNVDREGLKKTRRVIDASCGCGSHDVTPYVAGRIAAGCRYTCRKCRRAIVVHTKVAPVAKKGGGRRRRAPRFRF
jgi:predicted SprT family Zn-dependent metalloprotease